MDNFEFNMMTQLDRHVVNNHIINSKDKDIKDIIFDCYSNLRSTQFGDFLFIPISIRKEKRVEKK